MEKKVLGGVLAVLTVAILFSGFAASQDEENIGKARSCLYSRVDETSSSSLTLQQAVFSALAGVPNSKVVGKINELEDSTKHCWPKSGCKIKDTAQVMLAKDKRGESTSGIREWLLSQNKSVPDIIWYLQITMNDNQPDECNVLYRGANHAVRIKEDMKLEGSLGECLSIAGGGYRLKIDSDCVGEKFTTFCNRAFKTNLLYQRAGGGTLYVSSETHGSTGGGTEGEFTVEQIKARCFAQGGSCDYEGSLWATTALYPSEEDMAPFIPYLVVLAPNNQRFFPAAFLEYVDRGVYYDDIISKRSGGYWDVGGGIFYDTSLAMLALGGADETAERYLFGVQGADGCWGGGSIRDTAFVLYAAGWGTASSGGGGTEIPIGSICADVNGTCATNCSSGETEVDAACSDEELCCVASTGGGGGGGALTTCSQEGYYCVQPYYTCTEAGGLMKDEYYCNTWAEVCCTIPVERTLESCYALGGDTCIPNEERCSGANILESSDGPCCIDGCEAVVRPIEECNSNSDCEEDEECINKKCVLKQAEGGGSLWTWIIILIILIILVVVAIVYREKIKLWWLKRKGKKNLTRPGAVQGVARRPPPRFTPRTFARPTGRPPAMVARRTTGSKDKEMEETLKKLKEMSK